MANTDFDFDDDAGPDDAAAFEEERFRRIMADQGERNAILRSIHLASGIEEEVAGNTPGFILHYLKDMQTQAVEAVAKMIASPSLSEEERLTAKLAVQPYAHLMIWLKEKVAMRRTDRARYEELEELINKGEI